MIPQTRFGKTNLTVTRIALGGYPFGGVNKARNWDPFSPAGRQTAIATVHTALDAGINYIDTAPSYGDGNSESIIGEATENRRDQFTLATKVGYRNLTPLIASGAFDVMQVRYNLIYQAAALHVLNQARAADLGVATMRTMTSGMLQRIAQHLAPGWQVANDLYEVALKFVLADSRVHLPIVGMRWPDEVARNVAIVTAFQPGYDMAQLPRLTAGIYQSEDEAHG